MSYEPTELELKGEMIFTKADWDSMMNNPNKQLIKDGVVVHTYSPTIYKYKVIQSYYDKDEIDTLLNTKVDIAQGSANVGKAMIVGNDGNLIPREYCYVFEFDTDVTTWTTTAGTGSTYQAIVDALSKTKDVYLLSHLNTGVDAMLVVSEDGLTNNYIRATGIMLPFGEYFAGICLHINSSNNISTTVTPLQSQLTAGSNININNNTISATDTTYSAGQNISINQNNQISAGIEVIRI